MQNLTIFVENKNKDGLLNNIFLKEDLGDNKYQIIFAKRGMFDEVKKKNILLLYDGKILNKEEKKNK